MRWFWSGIGAPQLMLAVRTKPSSVLAERKLLMRLDGVCRHYLAMTKSALFLFADGGKFNRGPQEKASLNRPLLLFFLHTAALLLAPVFCFCLFVLMRGYSCAREPESSTNCSGSRFCPTVSFSRCCSDRKKAQLCPNFYPSIPA